MIGAWVRRKGGKWHLCESVIADDAITNCGRRLNIPPSAEVSPVRPPTQVCKQCS